MIERSERIRLLHKRLEEDRESFIQAIKSMGYIKAGKALGCSTTFLMAHLPRIKPEINPYIGNTNGRKGLIDENGRECTSCKQYKNWSEFNKHSQSKTGYNPKCKPCQKLYNQIYIKTYV